MSKYSTADLEEEFEWKYFPESRVLSDSFVCFIPSSNQYSKHWWYFFLKINTDWAHVSCLPVLHALMSGPDYLYCRLLQALSSQHFSPLLASQPPAQLIQNSTVSSSDCINFWEVRVVPSSTTLCLSYFWNPTSQIHLSACHSKLINLYRHVCFYFRLH